MQITTAIEKQQGSEHHRDLERGVIVLLLTCRERAKQDSGCPQLSGLCVQDRTGFVEPVEALRQLEDVVAQLQ